MKMNQQEREHTLQYSSCAFAKGPDCDCPCEGRYHRSGTHQIWEENALRHRAWLDRLRSGVYSPMKTATPEDILEAQR